MKIKIDISKNKIKNQYYKRQKHEKSMIAIIYINEFDIKNKINAIIYNAIINKVRYQHLEKNTYYNIFMTKLMILQLMIEIL